MPIKMLKGTIAGQIAARSSLESAYGEYQKALSYGTILDRDSRNTLVSLFVGQQGALRKMPDQKKAEEMLEYVVQMAEDNVAYNPGDSMFQMVLAQMLNTAAGYYGDNADKFTHYSMRALDAINKSIEASPGRVPIYYYKSQIYVNQGKKEEAIETMLYAAELNTDYYDSYCNLSRTYFFYKDEEKGFSYMNDCIDKGGVNLLKPKSYIMSLISHYDKIDDSERSLKLYKYVVERLKSKDPKEWVDLAKRYKNSGDIEKAAEAARKASDLDPKLAPSVSGFIDSL